MFHYLLHYYYNVRSIALRLRGYIKKNCAIAFYQVIIFLKL